ncbi:hypothetical protein Sste5346_001487 [Sporothrix stenoceras]|uniref:RING-type domain-containing protein n=1 Tax=Sporothrix stenoceras TaxID=5173 RepID=A0ABR3ZPB9_9PEZI
MVKKEAEEASTDTTPESSRDGTPDDISEIDLNAIPVNHSQDSPGLFPSILSKVVPRTDLAGKHNCGKHERVSALPGFKKAGLPLGELHTLSCGHVLCQPCLESKALSIARGVYDADIWSNFLDAPHKEEYAETFYDYDGLPHGEGPPKSALKALDMLCCGLDSRLDRYIKYMDQDVAIQYWVAHQAVRTTDTDNLRSQYGWPDCQRQRRYSLIKPIDGSTVPSRPWYNEGAQPYE